MSTKLYEITEQFKELEKLAEEGVDIADTIESVEGDFNDKALAIVEVSENIGAMIPAIDEQIKRLQAKKKAIQNKQKALIEYLDFNMKECGISKIECPLFTISYRKQPDVLEVIDESKIDPEYMILPEAKDFRPDKREILKALKSGKSIDGCRIKSQPEKLTIKG